MTAATPDDPVTIYTDGACLGNPGPGGWGVVISRGGRRKEFSGGVREKTTNQRMELTAAIEALKALKMPLPVRLHSDSQYLIKGAKEWLTGWKRRNWKNVKNPDLWKELDHLMSVHQIEWVWVRGHNGNTGNERADCLASQAAARAKA